LVIEPAYGHTRGHSVLHLSTDDGEAYFTGDVFHHPIQMVDPSLHLPGCDDLETAIETRRQLIPKLVETQALVIPAHFPAPHAGRLHGMNDSITFNPVETA
jgi:glyoxylase-like metal-dependent hydrolase (beta-lactamase superfamily II)